MVMLAIALIVLFPSSSSAWVMTHPRHLPTPTTSTTRLKYNDDDFASLSNSEAEEEGLRLAREFYKELQLRRQRERSSDILPFYEYDNDDDDDENCGCTSKSNGEGTSIRNVGSSWIRRTSSVPSSSSSSAPRESSLEALFSFFSSLDSSNTRRTTSAGLFSGSGISVYSPGRSLRAEIELLETIINQKDAASAISNTDNDKSINNNDTVWNGIYIGTLSLIILSVVSSGVGMDMIMTSDDSPVASFEDAFASLNHLVAVIDDVTREGISSVMIIANNGEVFMDEEAHWLIRESSELAATIRNTMQSSMEQLVMK